MRRTLPAVFGLFVLSLVPAPVRSADDDPKTTAQAILDKGAALFSTKDARAMAATYAEDAELTVVMKSSTETKSEIKSGRAAIEEYYRKLFEGEQGTITAKNTVEYARALGPDFLIIAGDFKPDVNKDITVAFVQTRSKVGDAWLVTNMRVFVLLK